MEVLVQNLIPGMILAEDIYSASGELVLSTGCLLTEPYIYKLERLNLLSVKIHQATHGPTALNHQGPKADSNVKDLKPYLIERNETQEVFSHSVHKFKSLFSSLKFGRQIGVQEIEDIVQPIIHQVENNKSIARQLWQLEVCDQYTFDHSVAVSLTAALLARWCNLDADAIKLAACAGLLHDIGKVNIPDAILNKPGRLTDEEMKVMKTHTTLGYVLLMNQKNLNDSVLKAALEHHERFDGKGYPHGLKGLQISQISRIVSIADVFSAMTTRRVYKEPTNPFKVASVMLIEAYGFLDPQLTQLFISRISNYYVGNVVKLSDNRIGEVVMINRNQPHRPLVNINGEFIDLAHSQDLEIHELIY